MWKQWDDWGKQRHRGKKDQDGKDRNVQNNNIMCAYSTQVNVREGGAEGGGGNKIQQQKKQTGDHSDGEMEKR